MNKFFRLGLLLALIVIVSCGVIALKIVFSDGEDSEVPNLVGLNLIDATATAERAGLSLRVDAIDSSKPKDTVITQNIDAGQRVQAGKTILVKVSKGGVLLTVPDVRGLSFAEAVKRLSDAGFTVGKVLRVTDSIKQAGSVIAQNPEAPQQVLGNRMVELLVSEGESGKTGFAMVPDLRGQTEKLAMQIIEQSSLSLDKVVRVPSNAAPEGVIIATRPRQGARVPTGSGIIIDVAMPLPAASADSGMQESAPPQDSTQTQTTTPPRTESPAETKTVTPTAPQTTQPAQPSVTPPAVETPTTPKPAEVQTPQPAAGRKIARIRYPVPPLTKPLELKIDMTDDSGTTTVRHAQAKGGEFISIDQPYQGTAVVTVYLGGDNVWQESFK